MLTIHIFETMRTLVASFSVSLSLSVCNSVSFSLFKLHLHNCCRMCARFFKVCSLTVSQEITRTHMGLSYRTGRYPWNQFDDVTSLVFSPPPSPPSPFSFLSIALSVCNLISFKALSLERAIILPCVRSDIYKFLRKKNVAARWQLLFKKFVRQQILSKFANARWHSVCKY